MSIRCGRATVCSWRRLSHGVSNSLLNEDLSLAINGFVMRPRLRGSLSLLWYGLEHRRSEDPRLPQVDRGISCPSLFGFSSISWLLVHDLCTAPSAVPASLSPAN